MVKHGYTFMQPIYPLLIQQFIDDYKLDKGIAVDLGTGPGFMGVELAIATDMEIYFTDISSDALKKAKKRFEDSEADNKAHFIEAPAENLPYNDNFADFIMSRGSIWFWEDMGKGLREVYRVLKPGGTAFIGGGLGRYMPSTMRKRIYSIIKDNNKKRGMKKPDFREYEDIVKKSGISNYRMLNDGTPESGKWVEIKK